MIVLTAFFGGGGVASAARGGVILHDPPRDLEQHPDKGSFGGEECGQRLEDVGEVHGRFLP